MQTLDFPLSHFITARRVRLLARLWLRRGCPPCPPGCCWGHAEPRSASSCFCADPDCWRVPRQHFTPNPPLLRPPQVASPCHSAHRITRSSLPSCKQRSCSPPTSQSPGLLHQRDQQPPSCFTCSSQGLFSCSLPEEISHPAFGACSESCVLAISV